jgi:hypothetical protein
MKIVDQRYLDSANRYSTEPCLLSILDLGHPAPACAAIPIKPHAAQRTRVVRAFSRRRSQRTLFGNMRFLLLRKRF